MAEQMDSQERTAVLQQVNEMFGTTLDTETIFCVVDSCNWKLDDSIDQLIELTSIVEASEVCHEQNMTKEDYFWNKVQEVSDDENLMQMSNLSRNNTQDLPCETGDMSSNEQSLKLEQNELSDWILVKKHKHYSHSNNVICKVGSTKTENTVNAFEESLSYNIAYAQNNNQPLVNVVPTSLVPSTHPANNNLCTNSISDKNGKMKAKDNRNYVACGQVKVKNSTVQSGAITRDSGNVAEKSDDATHLPRYQIDAPWSEAKLSLEASRQSLNLDNTVSLKSQETAPKTAYERIIEDIIKGYKILILLRGAPGSGKSYLARSIISQTVGGNPASYVYSTDDYFINLGRGRYIFDPSRLQDAHTWNQERTWLSLKGGKSPIIIDNTNTQLWEMRPYAAMAVNTGYNVEVLQPNTPWFYDVDRLSMKNIHGVPKAKIRQMIQRFEDIPNGSTLLHTFRLVDDKVKKPHQLRSYPPLNVIQPNVPIPSNEIQLNNLSRTCETKENSLRKKEVFSANSSDESKIDTTRALTEQCKTMQNDSFITKDSYSKSTKIEVSTSTSDKDFNLLRVIDSMESEYRVINSRGRDINNVASSAKNEIQELKESMVHKSCGTDELNCEFNEANDAAASMKKIKEMFTDISDDSLNEICRRFDYDCDRVIDFLLEEKEHFFFSEKGTSGRERHRLAASNAAMQKSKNNRFRFLSDSSNSSDDDGCGHVQTIQQSYAQNHCKKDIVNPPDSKCTDCTEVIELNIGKDIMRVLEHEFGSSEFSFPEGLSPIVQIKRTWARLLYELCVKSAHNQLDSEQKRLDQIKKDAEYAKLLAKENAQNEEQRKAESDGFTEYIGSYRCHRRSKLKKLHKIFPNFSKVDLNQILMAHNGNFEETVDVIKASTGQSNTDELVDKADELNANQSTVDINSANNADDDYRGLSYKNALKNAREARREARIQLHLRNENMRKARNICKKDPKQALLYTELAQEHANNMDKANATAATAYLAAQTYVLNQENILDLHHLYVPEAITALNVFLDYHIKKLQEEDEESAIVYVITGWGAHSNTGHSKIKEAVGKKLDANNISFINDNPGRFKVTLEKDTQYDRD